MRAPVCTCVHTQQQMLILFHQGARLDLTFERDSRETDRVFLGHSLSVPSTKSLSGLGGFPLGPQMANYKVWFLTKTSCASKMLRLQ